MGSLLVLPIDLDLNTEFLSLFLITFVLVFTWIPLDRVVYNVRGLFFIIGVISSFLSNFIGATGPLSAPFFLHSHMKKHHFVVTKAACQLPVHLLKVIVYMFSGFMLRDWIFYILSALPLVYMGNILGKYMTQKIAGEHYKSIVKIMITLIVLRMLIKIIL